MSKFRWVNGRTRAMHMLRQLFSFGAIGAGATGLQYLILSLLVEFCGSDPVAASTVSYITSAIPSYLLNYRLTFSSMRPHFHAFPFFALIATTGLLLNGAIMYFCVNFLQLYYLIAQIFSTMLVFLWNFFANRHLTFRSDTRT